MQDSKLERINLVAKTIFTKRGYAETRITDIANKAEVSVGTIYKYYKNKKELFDSLDIPDKESFRPLFEMKKQEILSTALKLFGEKGYCRATMDDISGELGLSKASLYQYFSNKEEMLLSIAKSSEMHSLLSNLPIANSKDLGVSSIEEIGFEFLNMYKQPEKINLLRTIICEAPNYPELGRMIYLNTIDDAFNKVAKFLGSTMPDQITSPKFAARAFLGMLLSFVVVDRLINGSEDSYSQEEIVTGVVDIFLNGIK